MMLHLAICPIRYLVKKKRIIYFHHLLKCDDNNLAKSVLIKQMEDPSRGDIYKDIEKDLKDLRIDTLSNDEIQDMSKNEFKRLVNKKTKEI